MNSYVVYYEGLLKHDCYKIIRALSPADAVSTLNSRFKVERRVIKVEPFVTRDKIPQVIDKLRAQQTELDVKRERLTQERILFETWTRTWPYGFVPNDPISYIVAVLLTAAK